MYVCIIMTQIKENLEESLNKDHSPRPAVPGKDTLSVSNVTTALLSLFPGPLFWTILFINIRKNARGEMLE